MKETNTQQPQHAEPAVPPEFSDYKQFSLAMAKIEVERRFTYHAPTPEQAAIYPLIRLHAKNLALFIVENCPDSRERDKAIDAIEAAVMNANASIARQPQPKP